MKITLYNKVYDLLKWIALIAIPACGVLYGAVAAVWNLPYAEQVNATANAVCLFIGSLIGLSTANYKA